jgi:hypothetical protein
VFYRRTLRNRMRRGAKKPDNGLPPRRSDRSAAHFYEQTAKDFACDKKEIAALEAFLNKVL